MTPTRARVMSFVLVAALATCLGGCREPRHFDTLIVSGSIIDGTGSTRIHADVGIVGGRIEAVGALDGATADELIDATGRVVTPGFIDMMGGSTLPLLRDAASAESKLRQGITTMMAGEGSSIAPQNDRTVADIGGLDDGQRWERFSE